ncbi:MAG: hypothetical protein LBP28_07680 [Coriobacteriales bacterium]|nr:hypothetical protein [Coriobacteriales bacterium]
MGFISYLEPTLTLLLGIFLYGEQFARAHAFCFALIWLGLILIAVEAVYAMCQGRREAI